MTLNTIDPSNPVVALCAAGMQVNGTPAEARRLFEQAWAARRDDYDACIAAHYLARHQPAAAETLHWNMLAVQHAEAVRDGRADEFFPSLYLNLADSLANAARFDEANAALERATASLATLAPDGYTSFLILGIERLRARIAKAASV